MKFKYNDSVKIDDAFYGKCKGIIKDVSHDLDMCSMYPKTGKAIHSTQCYSYLVVFEIDGILIEKEFEEEDLK